MPPEKAQITNQYIFKDSVCIYFFRWQHQRSCTRHMFSFSHYLQGPREVCFVLLPVDIASFVVVPSAVEIDRAVQSLLKHCPPSTAYFLDLKYIECTGIVRIDCINTADSLSSFVECSTVQSCRLKMKGKDITKKTT